MLNELNTMVTDISVLRQGFIMRDGFVFALGDKPAVYDTLVIRNPANASAIGCRGFSNRTLEEHIALVNKYQLKKAKIVCRDLSFIVSCPSLSEVSIDPDDYCGSGFDYSPLYSMPNLRSLSCRTVYGIDEQYQCSLDYTQFSGVVDVAAAGAGHVGYETIPNLEVLWVSKNKEHKDFLSFSCSTVLTDVTLMFCSIRSLVGIEKNADLHCLALYDNRSLCDISSLGGLSESLRVLAIENCPRVADFSVLSKLINLEHLQLHGSNELSNLDFLRYMPKLKTFTVTMNVLDGDLSLCQKIPYASCKNRKHYNLKDTQLPKQLPNRCQ